MLNYFRYKIKMEMLFVILKNNFIFLFMSIKIVFLYMECKKKVEIVNFNENLFLV